MQEFSVKEISHILSSILKNAFPEMVAVTGEISQVSKQIGRASCRERVYVLV